MGRENEPRPACGCSDCKNIMCGQHLLPFEIGLQAKIVIYQCSKITSPSQWFVDLLPCCLTHTRITKSGPFAACNGWKSRRPASQQITFVATGWLWLIFRYSQHSMALMA